MMKHAIQELLEVSELTVRSYSGRGMFGKTCLGVETNSFEEVSAALFFQLAEVTNLPFASEVWFTEETMKEISAGLLGAKTDSLGKRMIVYFPNIPFVDSSLPEDFIIGERVWVNLAFVEGDEGKPYFGNIFSFEKQPGEEEECLSINFDGIPADVGATAFRVPRADVKKLVRRIK